MKFDSSAFKRDASKVHADLKLMPDFSVVAMREIRIMIPSEYFNRGIARQSMNPDILGIHCILNQDGFYGISTLPNMVKISPSRTDAIIVDDEPFTMFTFDAGSVVYVSTVIPVTSSVLGSTFDELFSSARIPWYITYLDIPAIASQIPKFTGVQVGNNEAVNELLTSVIARSPKDRTKYYRTEITSMADLETNQPIFVKLRSVEYGASNTLSKLNGSYFTIGVGGALTRETTRVENFERLLRM